MEVQLLPVVVAGIVGMIIGALWYSPALFGKQWARMIGMSVADMEAAKKGMGGRYVGGFVAQLVMAYVLAQVLVFAAAGSLTEAFQTAFWLWLGFIATVSLGSVLWQRKSIQLYILNISYWLVSLLAMSSVLIKWVV